ncbi:UDP-Glycosyltransferase/glycogen phosphorylase [Trametes gibbosa]|nr:UDP-Glycosyltransferase/glycogen phosphorylase [Trametes gibbosa]
MISLKHILFLPLNWWGHTRPMCTLAARMVRHRPVHIMLFVAAPLAARTYEEVSAELLEGEAHLLARISFVPLEHPALPTSSAAYDAAFVAAWEGLQAGKSLPAFIVSMSADGDLKPVSTTVSLQDSPICAAIVDMFMISASRALRSARINTKAGPQKLPLYSWMAAATNCMAAWFTEDRLPAARALAEGTGVSFDVAAHKVLMGCEGRIVHSPCLPPMYDYELHPQGAPIPPEFCGQLVIHIPSVLRDTDGVVTIDAAEYHPSATCAMRAHFAPPGQPARPVVYAGPLVPGSAHMSLRPPKVSVDVSAFLNRHLEVHGERSVLLISFGSMFWPSDPATLGAVLDVIMELGIPFTMSCASPLAAIPDDIKQRLSSYQDAFLAEWIPQKFILDHNATGWCLTHAVHNSVLECITAGVPMILWPIDADQAPNAVHLSTQLRIAHELLAVRHGVGRGVVHRTGCAPPDDVRADAREVLVRAFKVTDANAADSMRGRLERVRTALGQAWGEEGLARREVEAFLDGC